MLTRLRNVCTAVAGAIECEKDDVLILVGLALVSVGLWHVWRPLALVVAGAVLLWVFLPPRPPFIDRPTVKRERRP